MKRIQARMPKKVSMIIPHVFITGLMGCERYNQFFVLIAGQISA